jgi:biotin carboxyl carrier protein
MSGQAVLAEDEPAVVYILSSWDGVFYAGEYFGDEPYVSAGSKVTPESVVGTIEGMRRFTVHAGFSGTIVEVMVGDSEMVYMGQPLFKVQLAPEPKDALP